MDNDDPITMYLVVPYDLRDLNKGKLCAQVSHAVGYIYTAYYRQKIADAKNFIGREISLEEEHLMDDWIKNGVRKVVLEAKPAQWEKLKQLEGARTFLVKDAGHTLLEPGTETCIGFMPMRKSERPKLLAQLQTLKGE
jgi:peptidyl-tRNA hydrolase